MLLDPDLFLLRVAPLWWLAFFAVFGLCVGSFLNVVIYRLPRDISLRRPRWSFCPNCQSTIQWYDNLPVLSYLRLGGKCRHCAAPISLRYPLVEVLTAIVIVLVFDAFFIAHTRCGLQTDWPGVTWQLSQDWPVFAAHVVLFAGLLAMSAIDLEYYWVDIRFTSVALVLGFLFHSLWTPRCSEIWPRPGSMGASVALVMTVVTLLGLAVLRLFGRASPPPPEQPEGPTGPADAEPLAAGPSGPVAETTECSALLNTTPDPAPEPLAGPSASQSSGDQPLGDAPGPADGEGSVAVPPAEGPHAGWAAIERSAVTLAALSLVILLVLAWSDGAQVGPGWPAAVRWAPGLLVLLALIVGLSAHPRDTDQEIMEAIEAERLTARRMVLGELAFFLPVILAGIAVVLLLQASPANRALADRWLHTRVWGDWQPLNGLATAATGFVVGGGIGWAVRIVTTLIWGKETFGTGDIHMMAAAGCVAGWPVVAVGFVLSSFLALGGWLLALPFKQTRAIPLGPWLSVAFLIVVILHDPIMNCRVIQNMVELYRMWPVIIENLTGA